MLDKDELFDDHNDSYELENLIEKEEYREIRDRMHESFMKMMNDTRDPFR